MLTLIEAPPGVGKTTALQRLAELLRERDVTLAGFLTGEIRDGTRRVGFHVETLGGERGTLAHQNLPGPPRVGRYGVSIGEFERIALPALGLPADVILIDELGKMELASSRFRNALVDLVEGDTPVVATVHAFHHPFTDALKRRPDATVERLTRENRDELPRLLAERLAPVTKEPRATGSRRPGHAS
ncbi:MAG TPA: nucleoside-triphosphatase [Solirubrobacteraceae bacterium]|nr:nucleoside-triphosphatase [Solirubrobacteraceae bacterium]